jgi:hypothetical protein
LGRSAIYPCDFYRESATPDGKDARSSPNLALERYLLSMTLDQVTAVLAAIAAIAAAFGVFLPYVGRRRLRSELEAATAVYRDLPDGQLKADMLAYVNALATRMLDPGEGTRRSSRTRQWLSTRPALIVVLLISIAAFVASRQVLYLVYIPVASLLLAATFLEDRLGQIRRDAHDATARSKRNVAPTPRLPATTAGGSDEA